LDSKSISQKEYRFKSDRGHHCSAQSGNSFWAAIFVKPCSSFIVGRYPIEPVAADGYADSIAALRYSSDLFSMLA
jgi:hypothetical protein